MAGATDKWPLDPPPPDVGRCYGHAWRQLWSNFGVLFGIFVVSALFMAVYIVLEVVALLSQPLPQTFAPQTFDPQIFDPQTFTPLHGVILIYMVGVLSPLVYGVLYAVLKIVRGEETSVGDMFRGFSVWASSVLANLLTGIIVVVPAGIVCAVGFFSLLSQGRDGVPVFLLFAAIALTIFTILTCKTAFVPYLVTDRGMGAWEAVQHSWRTTKGHAVNVFVIFLLGTPIAIGGLICFLVGVIPAMMWTFLANASLYFAVSAREPRGVEQERRQVP